MHSVTDINSLKPEDHGNEFCVTKDKHVQDIIVSLCDDHNEVSLYIAMLVLSNGGKKEFTIPCMRCYKDMILRCEDIVRHMKEIIEPVKKK